MNKQRRGAIQDAISKLEDCKDLLSSVKDEEDEARENMPENLEGSEAYSFSEDCSDNIEEAISSVEEAIDTLGEI